MEIEADTVRRFAAALRAAVRDKQIEARQPSRFYYDADVLLRIINGFQQFKRDLRPNRDSRNVMVRSLLACGLAGRLHVLRPHALEIDEDLRSRPKIARGGVANKFKKDLLDFLEEHGIAGLFLSLHHSLRSTEDPNDKVDRFFRILADRDASNFPLIELADGDWQQRLARFQKRSEPLIVFDDGSPSVKDVLRDDVVWQIRDLIDQEHRPMSVLHDATALAMLHREIARLDAGEDVAVVRFYSESDLLHRAFQKPELRQLLTYQARLSSLADADFTVRGPDYFILRMLFEDLRFVEPTLQRQPSQTSSTDLIGLSEELSGLVAGGGRNLERFLDSHLVAEKPLKYYLDEFKNLSFVPTFLHRWEPTGLLRETIAALPEVWDFAVQPEVRDRFTREALRVLTKLRETVQELRDTFADLRKIIDAANSWRASQTEAFRLPDPTRDLGLIRWGIELAGENLEMFNSLIGRIVAPEEEKRWRGCVDLADTLSTADDEQESYAIACSVLWALNMFDVIVEALERIPPAGPTGLRLLYLAAKLRARRNIDRNDKVALLEKGSEAISLAPAAERPRYLIGLGYLYFHAWLLERENTIPAFATADDLPRIWLHRSLELGDEAVQSLPKGTLSWAFALNHCVYVGEFAEVETPALERNRDELRRLWYTHRNLWNYRFADTIGFHHLVRAEREFRSIQGLRVVSERSLRSLQGSLGEAERHYARIETGYGDDEIEQHLESLRILKAKSYSLSAMQEDKRMTSRPFPPNSEPTI